MSSRSSSFSCLGGRVSVTRTRGCHYREARILVETPLHRIYLDGDVKLGQLEYLVGYVRRNGVQKVVGDLDFVDSVLFRAHRLQGYREELAQIE